MARFSSDGAENLIGSLKGRFDSIKSRFAQGSTPTAGPRSARSHARFRNLDTQQDTRAPYASSADFDDDYACDENTAREFAEYGPSYNEDVSPLGDAYGANTECAPLVSQSDIRARAQQIEEPSFNSATGRMLYDQLTPAYESPREKAERMAQGREQSRTEAFSEKLTARGRMSVPHVNNPQRAAYESVASRQPHDDSFNDARQSAQDGVRTTNENVHGALAAGDARAGVGTGTGVGAGVGAGSASSYGNGSTSRASSRVQRAQAAAQQRASEQRSSGLHSLFAQGSAQELHTQAASNSTRASRFLQPNASAAPSQAYVPAASSQNKPSTSAHDPLGAAAFPTSSPARSICMLTAHNYNDAEHIVDALKRGDITVLALNLVSDALSKRILDFCFGVCAVLGGHVDLIKPGVYLFYTGSALSQSEFIALRERGVLL